MAVTYDNTVKAARMTATRDVLAAGTLELLDAGNNVLAIFTLSAAGGSIAADVWTLTFGAGASPGQTVQGEAAAGGGTDATQARVKDSGGTPRITGLTVGTSGTDVVLDNNNIADGQDVSLTAATFTHA